MGQLLNVVGNFIKQAIAVSVMGSFLLVAAGEIRLAALKKASHGSSKLSGFTQKMTKTKVRLD